MSCLTIGRSAYPGVRLEGDIGGRIVAACADDDADVRVHDGEISHATVVNAGELDSEVPRLVIVASIFYRGEFNHQVFDAHLLDDGAVRRQFRQPLRANVEAQGTLQRHSAALH